MGIYRNRQLWLFEITCERARFVDKHMRKPSKCETRFGECDVRRFLPHFHAQ